MSYAAAPRARRAWLELILNPEPEARVAAPAPPSAPAAPQVPRPPAARPLVVIDCGDVPRRKRGRPRKNPTFEFTPSFYPGNM